MVCGTLTQNAPNELCSIMLERASVIAQMKKNRLNLTWLRQFALPQLSACCERMDSLLPGNTVYVDDIQGELIRNPSFAGYFAGLLALFPEEPPVVEPPKPAPRLYGKYRPTYQAPAPKRADSLRSTLLYRLSCLIDMCDANECRITDFPKESVMAALELDRLDNYNRLVLLKNFITMELSKAEQMELAENLHTCVDVPLELSNSQREVLCEPFITTVSLFASATFGEVWMLLESYPTLLDFVVLIHNNDINEGLHLQHYKSFAKDADECYRIVTGIVGRLDSRTASAFINFWKKGGCSVHELQSMERQMASHADMDWETAFSNYSGYINLLYGARFKTIDLSDVRGFQEDILIHAIVNKKKRFIRLVDENTQLFPRLPSDSLLFAANLYENHFNLNELTEKNLEECTWMKASRLRMEAFEPGRQYTFPELKAFYDASEVYVSFYNRIASDSQDYRLRVLGQLVKRNLLNSDMSEAELWLLADRLTTKPLYDWQQNEFGHIAGLKAGDVIQLLIHMDKLLHLLPYIHNRTDAMLALRNLEHLGSVDTVDDLKSQIVQIDADWGALANRMMLSVEFQNQHRERIIEFLCKNGAYIVNTYLKGLDSGQAESFLRVVKAELMGEFSTLKYFEGDLQRELDYPINASMQSRWREHLHFAEAGVSVQEYDDFFSTMLLGVQPQRTCQSYIDGQYRECLLSAFDSNKKLLYAKTDGKIRGRAFLRLTKGCMTTAAGKKKAAEKSFTFVDVENIQASRKDEHANERVILFLERPYISGVGTEQQHQIKRMFIELASRKADEMGTMLVLSKDYHDADVSTFAWTRFNVYISKSKAGAQYLDSLNGEATVSTEGSYAANNFLVRESWYHN